MLYEINVRHLVSDFIDNNTITTEKPLKDGLHLTNSILF